MPKTYSEEERNEIQNALRQTAFSLVKEKGIKKTTVDELVEAVHIPKGTFYLFYASKEMLLYDAIMQKHDEMHERMSSLFLKKKDTFTTDTFTDFLLQAFLEGFSLGIIPLLLNGELEILLRKLPDEIVSEHLENDDDFFKLFKYRYPNLKRLSLDKYSAAFRAIFFTSMFKREIGKYFEKTLRILIRGIVFQMEKENNDNNK